MTLLKTFFLLCNNPGWLIVFRDIFILKLLAWNTALWFSAISQSVVQPDLEGGDPTRTFPPGMIDNCLECFPLVINPSHWRTIDFKLFGKSLLTFLRLQLQLKDCSLFLFIYFFCVFFWWYCIKTTIPLHNQQPKAFQPFLINLKKRNYLQSMLTIPIKRLLYEVRFGVFLKLLNFREVFTPEKSLGPLVWFQFFVSYSAQSLK